VENLPVPCVAPYTIIVPSHKRAERMPQLLSLLPTATICVEESEGAAYAARVPEGQLLLHPPVPGMAALRNWLLDHCPTETCVQIDDDLEAIFSQTWERARKITDPNIIRQLIENGVNIATDLGLGLFCWGRMPVFYNGAKPFGLTSMAMGAVVIRRGRLRFDDRITMHEDFDLTLQALLVDRVVLCDRRFYWDFGTLYGEPGGAQAQRTAERMRALKVILKEKWGKYALLDQPTKLTKLGKQESNAANVCKVSRRSSLVRSSQN
jgi:hypothetical protein